MALFTKLASGEIKERSDIWRVVRDEDGNEKVVRACMVWKKVGERDIRLMHVCGTREDRQGLGNVGLKMGVWDASRSHLGPGNVAFDLTPFLERPEGQAVGNIGLDMPPFGDDRHSARNNIGMHFGELPNPEHTNIGNVGLDLTDFDPGGRIHQGVGNISLLFPKFPTPTCIMWRSNKCFQMRKGDTLDVSLLKYITDDNLTDPTLAFFAPMSGDADKVTADLIADPDPPVGEQPKMNHMRLTAVEAFTGKVNIRVAATAAGCDEGATQPTTFCVQVPPRVPTCNLPGSINLEVGDTDTRTVVVTDADQPNTNPSFAAPKSSDTSKVTVAMTGASLTTTAVDRTTGGPVDVTVSGTIGTKSFSCKMRVAVTGDCEGQPVCSDTTVGDTAADRIEPNDFFLVNLEGYASDEDYDDDELDFELVGDPTDTSVITTRLQGDGHTVRVNTIGEGEASFDWQAENPLGCICTGTVSVTVSPREGISCKAITDVSLGAGCGDDDELSATRQISWTDNNDTSPTVTYSIIVSGSAFDAEVDDDGLITITTEAGNSGTGTITAVVTTASGRKCQARFNVTVTDTPEPSLQCDDIDNVTLEVGGSSTTRVADWSNSGGACSGSPAIRVTQSGSGFTASLITVRPTGEGVVRITPDATGDGGTGFVTVNVSCRNDCGSDSCSAVFAVTVTGEECEGGANISCRSPGQVRIEAGSGESVDAVVRWTNAGCPYDDIAARIAGESGRGFNAQVEIGTDPTTGEDIAILTIEEDGAVSDDSTRYVDVEIIADECATGTQTCRCTARVPIVVYDETDDVDNSISTQDMTFTVGDPAGTQSVQITRSGSTEDSFSMTLRRVGGSIDNATASISGVLITATPTSDSDDAGDSEWEVTATFKKSGQPDQVATSRFTITVEEEEEEATWTCPAPLDKFLLPGASINVDLSATQNTGDAVTLRYSLAGDLESPLSGTIGTGTGQATFTADATVEEDSEHTVGVVVRRLDTNAIICINDFKITVKASASNPPSFTCSWLHSSRTLYIGTDRTNTLTILPDVDSGPIDELSVVVTSDDTDVVTVTNDGTSATLTPVGVGTATISATATGTNSAGEDECTASFSVEVEAAPVKAVLECIDGKVVRLPLSSNPQSVCFPLTDLFNVVSGNLDNYTLGPNTEIFGGGAVNGYLSGDNGCVEHAGDATIGRYDLLFTIHFVHNTDSSLDIQCSGTMHCDVTEDEAPGGSGDITMNFENREGVNVNITRFIADENPSTVRITDAAMGHQDFSIVISGDRNVTISYTGTALQWLILTNDQATVAASIRLRDENGNTGDFTLNIRIIGFFNYGSIRCIPVSATFTEGSDNFVTAGNQVVIDPIPPLRDQPSVTYTARVTSVLVQTNTTNISDARCDPPPAVTYVGHDNIHPAQVQFRMERNEYEGELRCNESIAYINMGGFVSFGSGDIRFDSCTIRVNITTHQEQEGGPPPGGASGQSGPPPVDLTGPEHRPRVRRGDEHPLVTQGTWRDESGRTGPGMPPAVKLQILSEPWAQERLAAGETVAKILSDWHWAMEGPGYRTVTVID